MRRKTKQLLATGMALAVMATSFAPFSFAAEAGGVRWLKRLEQPHRH